MKGVFDKGLDMALYYQQNQSQSVETEEEDIQTAVSTAASKDGGGNGDKSDSLTNKPINLELDA